MDGRARRCRSSRWLTAPGRGAAALRPPTRVRLSRSVIRPTDNHGQSPTRLWRPKMRSIARSGAKGYRIHMRSGARAISPYGRLFTLYALFQAPDTFQRYLGGSGLEGAS